MAVRAGPESTRATITLHPSGRTFDADEDETLLRAALDAGVPLPSSCRNGTCRTCRCRLLQGRVQHLIPWPGLSAEEKAEGWILPCVASAEADCTLEATETCGIA